MAKLMDIEILIDNKTALAAYLKNLEDGRNNLEENMDNLFILLNAIIVYCKWFLCFKLAT